MKRLSSIILVLMILATAVLSQEEKQITPVALQIAAPIYPQPAIALSLEETIIVEVKIDKRGKVTPTNFNRGAKFFHVVIEDALKHWRFRESSEKERQTSISFTFTLLPFDSKNFTSTVFRSPNTVEVFAKKVRIINTVDR